MVPTMTHFRSGGSSFLKTESIPSFMKTAFLSPSAAALIHPSWFCEESEKGANNQLSLWAWWEWQGKAREGALGGKEAGGTLFFLQEGPLPLITPPPLDSRPSSHPTRPSTKQGTLELTHHLGCPKGSQRPRETFRSFLQTPIGVDQCTA